MVEGRAQPFQNAMPFPFQCCTESRLQPTTKCQAFVPRNALTERDKVNCVFCRYACKYHALWISLSHTLWISSPTLTMMLPGLPVGSGMPHHIICLWVLSLYQNKKEATDHWEKVLCFTGRLDQDWHSRCFRRQQDPSVFTPWHVTILHFEGYCVLATQDLLILKKNAVRVDLDALCRHARQSNADMMIVGFIHSTLGLE